MLVESGLPKKFWAEAINTAFDILNKAMVRPILNKTPYELLKGKKPNISYFKLFDLVHMNLFGPIRTLSLNDKRFSLVIVDDYSRFSWVFFIFHKNEAFDKFLLFFRRVQIAHRAKVATIQTDHGGEFENNSFDEFYDE